MIIVDPVALGDAACTRPSPKWVYDRTGTLVEVPVNTLAVSYDPSDLSAAPFAVVDLEPETNYIRNNTMQGAGPGVMPNLWGPSDRTSLGIACDPVGAGVENGIEFLDLRYSGTATSAATLFLRFEQSGPVPAKAGQKWVGSVLLKAVAGDPSTIQMFVTERDVAAGSTGIQYYALSSISSKLDAHSAEYDTVGQATSSIYFGLAVYFNAGQAYDFTLRVALPHLCRDKLPRFPIKTSNGAVTRAADVIGPTAGLIYSNVPMVEPPYDAATTYAKDAAVYDPATKIVYWSMQAANVGKPLSDPAWWNKRTAINRWAMFDDRNSTVTSNPEEIIAVVSARAITQGFFAGALDASEVRISMTHPTRGVVYSETRSLVLPRSGSSFYGWCFNRLRMRTWFRTLKLPVFANALVTITILRPGGVPKCGMALLGPVEDGGSTLMGLSTELKDYSTTTFFADGSSETIPRGFSKRMSVDVSVERDRAESLEDYFTKRRQKTLVIFGSTQRGDAMLVGKVSSFRKVIDSYPRSKMALQIEGVLSQ
ncbi:hypothetical protein [Massilia timonae]|uniref:Uncharacterized protein n=1 Tax=Massilia timonae TaxID=47229 RepID=A0A1S2NAQ8_9BURK|nr:hypothetical protein [Massilia timonae]OIJ42177.1 hypothetical protein LO55_5010 [Massilia timonae]